MGTLRVLAAAIVTMSLLGGGVAAAQERIGDSTRPEQTLEAAQSGADGAQNVSEDDSEEVPGGSSTSQDPISTEPGRAAVPEEPSLNPRSAESPAQASEDILVERTSVLADGSAGPWGETSWYFNSGRVTISPRFPWTGQGAPAGRNQAPWSMISVPPAKVKEIAFQRGIFTLTENSDRLFEDLLNLDRIDGLELLDTSKVTNMSTMFKGTRSLRFLNLSGWNTEKVETMSQMFAGAETLADLDISGWDTSGVTDMNEIFEGCTALKSLTLGEKLALPEGSLPEVPNTGGHTGRWKLDGAPSWSGTSAGLEFAARTHR